MLGNLERPDVDKITGFHPQSAYNAKDGKTRILVPPIGTHHHPEIYDFSACFTPASVRQEATFPARRWWKYSKDKIVDLIAEKI